MESIGYDANSEKESSDWLTTAQIKDTANKLRHGLQEIFKNSTLPNFSFIPATFDIERQYIEQRLKSDGKPFSLEDTFGFSRFFGFWKSRPTRIFVESSAGKGKTTFVLKVMYDWAVRKSYADRFHLAFFINLGDLKKKSLEDALAEMASICGICNRGHLWQVLNYYSKQLLMVFDGFHELPNAEIENIQRVLCKKKFADAVVLLTAQTELLSELANFKNFDVGKNSQTLFYDSKIVIEGISPSHRQKLLEKYISPESATKTIKFLNRVSQPVAEIFEFLPCLLLLGFSVEFRNDLTGTKTDLYKWLVYSSIRKSMENRHKIFPADFDIFNIENRVSAKYQQLLHRFGNLAMRSILDGKEGFVSCEIMKNICNLGLLILENRFHYAPIHSSIVEFLCAYSMWRDFRTNSNRFDEKTVEFLTLLNAKSGESSPILQFLLGLLEKDTIRFFQQVEKPVPGSSLGKWGALCILKEYDEANEILKSLEDDRGYFVNYHSITNLTLLLELIIDFDKNKTERLVYFNKSSMPKLYADPIILPMGHFKTSSDGKAVIIEDVSCYIEHNIESGFAFLRLTNLRCENETAKYFAIANSITTKKYDLECDSSTGDIIMNSIANGLIRKTKVAHLTYHVLSTRIFFGKSRILDLIEHLVENNEIENLTVTISNGSKVDTSVLMEKIERCESLRFVDLPSPTNIDWNRLGIDNWKYLDMKTTNVTFSKKFDNREKCLITCLRVTATETSKLVEAIKLLSQSRVSILECSAQLLYYAYVFGGTVPFENITELVIFMDKNPPFKELSLFDFLGNVLDKFERLKALRLIGTSLCRGDVGRSFYFVPAFARLEHLSFWGVGKNDEIHLNEFLKALLSTRGSKNNALRSLDLSLHPNSKKSSHWITTLELLLERVRVGRLKEISLVRDDFDVLRMVKRKEIVDESVFGIDEVVLGNRVEDLEFDKINYQRLRCNIERYVIYLKKNS